MVIAVNTMESAEEESLLGLDSEEEGSELSDGEVSFYANRTQALIVVQLKVIII